MIQVPMPASNGDLYLDVMKKSLLASIYRENAWYVLGSLEDKKHKSIKGWLRAQIIKLAWANGLLIVKPKMADGEAANWGLFSYTMVGMPRLNNIQACIEDVIKNKIDGDLIETGVWRGGATI